MEHNHKLKPLKSDHSIKEAVISVFLANPILKPERFKDLIEGEFKDGFQQFEEISQVQFQIKQEQGNFENTPPQISKNIGFRFAGFDKGQIVKVLQGINEINRTYISFHCLDYSSWANFYSEYLKRIKVIANIHTELFVTAFSLHYVDQFIWIDENPIKVEEIFCKNSDYLPKQFFDSKSINYNLTTEKIDENTKYFDRLEISIDPQTSPLISISHNMTITIKELIELKALIEDTKTFSGLLNIAHDHNKEILRSILVESIKKEIHIDDVK